MKTLFNNFSVIILVAILTLVCVCCSSCGTQKSYGYKNCTNGCNYQAYHAPTYPRFGW